MHALSRRIAGVFALLLACNEEASPPVADAPAKPAAPAPLAKPEVAFQSQDVTTGVVVTRDGRLFVNFSRFLDPAVKVSVVEVVDGAPVAFPEGFKQDDGEPADDRLLSIQAMTVDAEDRLWLLDTGKVGQQPIAPGAAKLVAYDLGAKKVVKTIHFAPEVAGPTAVVNDVRVDLGRGEAGIAFITDSSAGGPNGIIVVDIAAGTARRRLNDHPSTRPEAGFVAVAEGQPLIMKAGPGAGKPLLIGSDGLEVTERHLYYRPLSGHRLYRVSADALADATISDEAVAATVEDLGDQGFASDGLLGDAQGRLYLTDYEHQAIYRRELDGKNVLIAQDPRLLWPDTLALDGDGGLLITNTQIHRSALFHGEDRRERPFTIFRVATDSKPLRLGKR